MDDAQLIELVRARPALLDKKGRNYANRDYVHKMWEQIDRIERKSRTTQKEIELSKGLLQKAKEDPGGDELKWPLYDAVSFLETFAECSITHTNFAMPGPSNFEPENNDDQDQDGHLNLWRGLLPMLKQLNSLEAFRFKHEDHGLLISYIERPQAKSSHASTFDTVNQSSVPAAPHHRTINQPSPSPSPTLTPSSLEYNADPSRPTYYEQEQYYANKNRLISCSEKL